jgi:threonine/homoserine/homoserine lactone efflux protein
MAQTIGTIILVVLALVAVTAILNFILGVLGIVFSLIPLLIKVAIFAGVFYLAWLVFRKLAHTTEN